ncbi:MAG TPA: ABC transporter substrate-binding protein [Candidatus Dormibacteraeota bacterium]|nr:ABC transporter substrate-binding protein [Candidatus Dormibacteraeota bacterium]
MLHLRRRRGPASLPLLALGALVVLLPAGRALAREADLIISQKADVETFDPSQTNNTSTHNVNINIFDTLVRLSDDGRDFVGELAESWKLVDPTTWQFKLRRGVKFHNGEELNAAAVKFTFDTMMDPERKTRERPTYAAFKEVRVDDPYTVSVVTHKPYAIALTQLQYLMIVPPGYVKQVGWDEFGRKPVGSGAFRLKEWERDVRVVLEANDAYWKGKPKVRTVAFRPIPEDASRIAAIQRGEVDIIDAVPYDRIKELQGITSVRISQRQGEQIYVGLDTLRVEPFKKREVRQALNHAVNADALVKNLLLGYAVRLNGPFFPTTPGYDEKLPAYAYDPERAKRMLAQAGYPGGFDVEFAVSPAFQGIAKGTEVGEAIAGQLGRVGVRAKITVQDSAAIFSAYSAKKLQMYLFAWKSSPEAGRHLETLLHSRTRGYYYQNPEADRLIDAYFAALDPRKRREAGRELHTFLREDAPWIFLYQQMDLFAVRKPVGWEAKPDYLMRMRDVSVAN